MSYDRLRLDRELAALVGAFRRAGALLDQGQLDDDTPPQRGWLWDRELRGKVAEDDDPLGKGLDAWWRALDAERRAWRDRVAVAEAFHRVRSIDGEGDTSLRMLRDLVLADPAAGRARDHLDHFSAHAHDLSGRSVDAWTRRYEVEGPRVDAVDGFDDVPLLAKAWLARTDDVAHAILPQDHGADLLRAALGRDAGEGWPARLRSRWLEEVFGPARWLEGRRVAAVGMPARLGATSFARAMGRFGVALLDGACPPHLPFALHQGPRSPRRPRRHALFAGLILTEAFQRRVLGLGDQRVGDQRRRIARAILASLRLDAFRLAVRGHAPQGAAALREAHAEIGQQVFGRAPAPSWITVLPAWHPRDGAAFAGALAAHAEYERLVERFDEDWFLNPEAAATLLATDAAPLDVAAPEAPLGDSTIERLACTLEALTG